MDLVLTLKLDRRQCENCAWGLNLRLVITCLAAARQLGAVFYERLALSIGMCDCRIILLRP